MTDEEYLARIATCLEPAAVDAMPDIEGRIHLSIAASLKRIADALTDQDAGFLQQFMHQFSGTLADASHDHSQRMKP